MTSAIDPTKPTEGKAYTSDVRANFQTASSEISSLQTAVVALQTALAAVQSDIALLKARQMRAAGLITGDLPATSSTEFVMAGINVDFVVPATETRAVFIVSGALGNTANNALSELRLIYGTGAPPAAGDLLSATNGTPVGAVVTMLTARSGDFDPFATAALVSDLVPGMYWFGVAYRADTGSATLSAMAITAFGLLDPLP